MAQDRGSQDANAIFGKNEELYLDSGFVMRATAETGEREEEHDATPSIDKGHNLEDFLPLGSLKISETPTGAQWEIAGRQYVCATPECWIRGEYAGVKANIRLSDPSDGFFHLGFFENWKPDGMAGYQSHMKAEGTIKYERRILKIKGRAVRENLGFRGTNKGIPNRIGYMGAEGLNWSHAFSDEFSWYIMAGHADRNPTGMLVLDGKIIHATGQSNVWLESIYQWIDPDSNQLVP
ncbi:hypothetical protein N7468_009773 [Penicillium chermesinum]|uniref:Uncharacterized protein n=1 Tax=Penicillium chermesinum TaxID=63820 RepID=A0A9W9NKU8_9EURO|nr:uncharacterized protein N7468_009773 [Penicillium chermesinum]KAJ5220569.1 hypothetical protein N7468_009773 [Penicillium chermesinum]